MREVLVLVQKTRKAKKQEETKKNNKIVSLDERQTVIQHMCPNVVNGKKYIFFW